MSVNLQDQIKEHYGHRIRVRSCGILLQNNKLLLLKHKGIGKKAYFWNVPGGEVEEKENLKECLVREFNEESNLQISVGKLLFMNEYIQKPLHALEFYFETKLITGNAKLGNDPEGVSILEELKWFDEIDFLEIDRDAKPQFLSKVYHQIT